ncbi:hypothetical protein Syun_024634 [Stephania yunnanensis]|uniref:CRAL-TRIO domain-containing protein n=1 Tax=Stephania yunnanensis TaxID=152371 RepID=A0AAP0NIJ7_9MAGN
MGDSVVTAEMATEKKDSTKEGGRVVLEIWTSSMVMKLSREKWVFSGSLLRNRIPLQRCESQGASWEVDDLMLRRFLRARDLDIEMASAMFLKYLKWRREFVPKGFISESEVARDLAQDKMFMQGVDKKGRPIVLAIGRKHYPHPEKGGVEELKRYVVYVLDKISERMPIGQEKFVGIGDVGGWGYSNCDIRGYIASLSILQDYYPERLGKMFLVHVPYIFMAAWKIIYPFIDKNTREKIVFVENKKLKSTLLQDIDESQIPEIYGGKMPLVPIHDISAVPS